MMLPTHALAGLAVALPLAVGLPSGGEAVLAAGFAGGVLPDFDMYVGHRKTLHFPVYSAAVAAAAVLLAVLWWTPLTAAAAAFSLGVAVHSLADAYGGGLELRPWEATSDRAVYDHYRGAWLAPRRWVRYDGAPEDLAVSLALGLPLLAGLQGPFRWLVFACLAVAAVYATVRRALPRIAEWLLAGPFSAALPEPVAGRLPARYREREPSTVDAR